MQTIIKYVVFIFLSFYVLKAKAQDTIQEQTKQSKIENLESLKQKIEKEEKENLKAEVEAINQRIDDKAITYEEAEILKEAAAKKRALNIQNRIAIVDNRISLLQRNGEGYDSNRTERSIIGISIEGDNVFTGIRIGNKKRVKKYDRRTSSDLVYAAGINNAIIDGVSFGDSPYKTAKSGFAELGYALKTRLAKDSNFARIKYGFSFQWNKYKIKDNKFFVQTGNETTLETFPLDLREAEIRFTNLVFPVHFEFGPSNKVEKDTYFRYNTYRKFKFGLGGYAGFNIGTQQKLRYKQDGDGVKEKIRRDYNANDFVYGVSTYVGLGSMSLYLKYDLSETFKDQAVKQNNISLGLRFDFD